MSETAHATDHAADHPSTKDYVRIAIFLAVLTAIEVALFYLDEAVDMNGWDGPLLVGLSTIKFIAVVGWFMHLRFEDSFLSKFFGAGFVLAMVLYGILLAAFGVFAIFG
ncbi:MAG: cytochrome C oxidase subunit IV family protein [Acidimicrobiia bacterium]|nr:cytochrome C oxidase subunit IV family protein [Acidimicrobiia bacterium]